MSRHMHSNCVYFIEILRNRNRFFDLVSTRSVNWFNSDHRQLVRCVICRSVKITLRLTFQLFIVTYWKPFRGVIFRKVVKYLTRFQGTQRVARFLRDSWASCAFACFAACVANRVIYLQGRCRTWLPPCDRASQRFDSYVACGDVCHNKPCWH